LPLVALDATSAWIRTQDQAFLTVDRGATWTQLRVPGESGASLGQLRRQHGVLQAQFFGGAMRRWYSSTDAGQTWTPLPGLQRDEHPGFYALWFGDLQRGLAIDWLGFVHATEDGGRTWAQRSEVRSTLFPQGWMHFAPDGTVWLATETQLLRSGDAGRSWRAATLPVPASAVARLYFADSRTGWLVACTGAGAAVCRQDLLRTDDGGEHWQSVSPSAAGNEPGALLLGSPRIYFRTPQEAWAPPYNLVSKPMRTTDGGRTWREVPTPNTGALVRDIHFADALHGWMVGEHGLVLATRDGGATWEIQESGTERSLSAVFALDGDNVFIGAPHGALLTTRTGGRF
jgi:photosystem II stability/assembly factor-like uncharacterized protein